MVANSDASNKAGSVLIVGAGIGGLILMALTDPVFWVECLTALCH